MTKQRAEERISELEAIRNALLDAKDDVSLALGAEPGANLAECATQIRRQRDEAVEAYKRAGQMLADERQQREHLENVLNGLVNDIPPLAEALRAARSQDGMKAIGDAVAERAAILAGESAAPRVAELEKALGDLLEHCSCQGRGYRSWNNFRVVKRCSSLSCQMARKLLGIEEPKVVTEAIARHDAEDHALAEVPDDPTL